MKYIVCEEIINGEPTECYSVRVDTDCSSLRFRIIKEFSTWIDAVRFTKELQSKR